MAGRFPKAVALLESMGIDANLILVDGIHYESYRTIRVGSDGKRLIDPQTGDFLVETHPWSRETGEKVLNTILEDIADHNKENPIRVLGEEHSIDRVVLLRRVWDMDPSEEAARIFVAAENELTPTEFAAYQDLYRKVSETTPIKSESE